MRRAYPGQVVEVMCPVEEELWVMDRRALGALCGTEAASCRRHHKSRQTDLQHTARRWVNRVSKPKEHPKFI